MFSITVQCINKCITIFRITKKTSLLKVICLFHAKKKHKLLIFYKGHHFKKFISIPLSLFLSISFAHRQRSIKWLTKEMDLLTSNSHVHTQTNNDKTMDKGTLLPIAMYLKKSQPVIRPSLVERGGFFMISRSGGLKPRAVAGIPSVTRFTHSSWTGIRASGMPKAAVKKILVIHNIMISHGNTVNTWYLCNYKDVQDIYAVVRWENTVNTRYCDYTRK